FHRRRSGPAPGPGRSLGLSQSSPCRRFLRYDGRLGKGLLRLDDGAKNNHDAALTIRRGLMGNRLADGPTGAEMNQPGFDGREPRLEAGETGSSWDSHRSIKA